MDTTSEMYLSTKFKFIKAHLTNSSKNLIHLNIKLNSTSTPNPESKKEGSSSNTNTNLSNSNEEIKKLEALEKLRLKEEKKKKMADICKAGEKADKKKTFTIQEEKFENKTPVGMKKDMSVEMAKDYNPEEVECSWDAWWTNQKFFEVSNEKLKQFPPEKRFLMLLPPPNVTGQLHLGHTLMGAIEDSITRYKRMNGYCSLWIPGTDHAGISCQTVVEKKILKEEKKYRKDFTREAFLSKVWEWKNEYGNKIFEQFRKIGVSFDWSRMYFTMDEERSKAVVHAFVDLFDRGILYRAKRIVHWCCTLKTAISDAEVDPLELKQPTMLKIPGYVKEIEFGVLINFSYKLKKDPTREIVISTTRIETMLGDVAVAVHSQDPRYKDLHGEILIHPFVNREIPIITDDILVDMNFGTGAVKITPAHDPNDFESGVRHSLPIVFVIDDEGNMTQSCGMFSGMKRYDCRVKIIEELKKIGQFKDKKPNPMVLNTCSKSGDIIEPMVKPQWWVRCKEVAERGLEDVKSGKLKIIPDFQKALWNHFLENIRDWCVSRQLWWGHRCPAYLVHIDGVLENPETHNNEHWVAASSDEEAIEKAMKKFNIKTEDKKKIRVVQDEDVLDTWFSSGILPLSLAGWPVKDENFDLIFPSNLLETGHDIIFFWVARMVFFGYMFADKLPFDTVYLHPIVRDAQGRKMSKSLGNVIDPLQVINGISLDKIIEDLKSGNLPEKEVKKCEAEKRKEYPNGIPKCGADALRIGLMSYMVQGRNINLDIQRVIGYRNFGNKLWNAVKFFINFALDKEYSFTPVFVIDYNSLCFINKWILNKFSKTEKIVNNSFETYSFGEAVNSIYSFWIDNFCDVYIEVSKGIFKSNDENLKQQTRNVMFYVIVEALKLLHPIAPFITEELYQRINYEVYSRLNKNIFIDSITVSTFPKNTTFSHDDIDNLGEFSSELVHKILSLNPQFSLVPELASKSKEAKEGKIEFKKPKFSVYLKSEDKKLEDFVLEQSLMITTLSKIESIIVLNSTNEKEVFEKKSLLKVVLNSTTDIYLVYDGYVLDSNKEESRLKSVLNEKNKNKTDLITKITAVGYEENASEVVKKGNKDKIERLDVEIRKIEECIKLISK